VAYAHAVAGASVTTVRQEGLAELYAAERQQKDNLCGCFWAALVLRAAGIEADQDGVAAAAGAILPGGDPQMHVAPGATPRNDYRVELPVDPTPGVAGTAAPAIARTIERLSGGILTAVPVAGAWTPDTVRALMDAAAGATLVANVRTGLFWGSHLSPAAVLAHLRGEDAEPPPADWDVGHFVNFAALVRGPAADLVVVRDTYQELGLAGHHLQPPDRVAAALRRDDGNEGGVLAVLASAAAPALRERLAREGFELRHWHNGTPDPEERLDG
jgi:uncharacterized protein DUF6885